MERPHNEVVTGSKWLSPMNPSPQFHMFMGYITFTEMQSDSSNRFDLKVSCKETGSVIVSPFMEHILELSLAVTLTYSIWENSNSISGDNEQILRQMYTGRTFTCCERWQTLFTSQHSFQAFLLEAHRITLPVDTGRRSCDPNIRRQ